MTIYKVKKEYLTYDTGRHEGWGEEFYINKEKAEVRKEELSKKECFLIGDIEIEEIETKD